MVVPEISSCVASPPPDTATKSSPGSHWIGDLTCGIIINHPTVLMYSLMSGLTSATSLPLPTVMIAFGLFVLPSFIPLHLVSVQPCRQIPSSTITRVCYPSTMLSTMDKAGFQKTDEKQGLSLSWETCIILPLFDKPNNRALSIEAMPTYIYCPPTHLLNILSTTTTTHILPLTVQLTPKPNSQNKRLR
jgi:hypothetical protein